MKKRKSTFGHTSKGSQGADPEPHPDDAFYAQELRKHQIQMNYWVTRTKYRKYEVALNILKKHFRVESNQEAIFRGLLYATENLAAVAPRTGNGAPRSSDANGKSVLRGKTGFVQDHNRANGHR